MPETEPGNAWMYKGPESTVNHEAYLTGRKLDKNFELYGTAKKAEGGGIESTVRRPQTKTRVVSELELDIVKKEDPLVAIKVREARAKNEILNNPVKMKKLHTLVMGAMEKKLAKALRKQAKKERKRAKKEKKARHDEEEADAVLKRRRRDSPSQSPPKKERREEPRHKHHSPAPTDARSRQDQSHRRPSPSPRRSRDDREDRGAVDGRRRERSPPRRDDRRREERSRDGRREEPRREEERRDRRRSEADEKRKPRRSRSKTPELKPQPTTSKAKDAKEESSDSSSSSESDGEASGPIKGPTMPPANKGGSDSEEDERNAAKARFSGFGLVSKDGDSIKTNLKPAALPDFKEIDRKKLEPKRQSYRRDTSGPKLTEEEKEARRREMEDNVRWREDQRGQNLKKYAAAEAAEAAAEATRNKRGAGFVKGVMTAAVESGSLESRLAQNKKRIQRSEAQMNSNSFRK